MSKLTDSLREGAHALLDKASDWQERIRHRAQAIWEREGRPEGRHEDHWREAEKEIAAEDFRYRRCPKETGGEASQGRRRQARSPLAPQRRVRKSQRPWPMQQHPKRSRKVPTLAKREARRNLLRTATPKTRRAAPKGQA